MKKFLSFILFFSLFLSSCSPFTLESSKVLNNANLSSYNTFMIQPAETNSLPEGIMIGDVKNVYNAVSDQFILRGYKEVSTNPDIIVFLAMSVKQKIETKDAVPQSGYGYRYFGRRSSYVHSYYNDAQIISGISNEGTLMMDVVDAKTNIHVFCSEVSSVADGTKIKDLQKIQEASMVLFSKFPVSPVK